MTVSTALIIGIAYAAAAGVILYLAVRKTGSRSVFATAGDTSSEFKLVAAYNASFLACLITSGLLVEQLGSLASAIVLVAGFAATAVTNAAYILGRSNIKAAKAAK